MVKNKTVENAKKDGISEGIKEGIREGLEKKIIKLMLNKNMSLSDISDISGKSIDYIKSLSQKKIIAINNKMCYNTYEF